MDTSWKVKTQIIDLSHSREKWHTCWFFPLLLSQVAWSVSLILFFFLITGFAQRYECCRDYWQIGSPLSAKQELVHSGKAIITFQNLWNCWSKFISRSSTIKIRQLKFDCVLLFKWVHLGLKFGNDFKLPLKLFNVSHSEAQT